MSSFDYTDNFSGFNDLINRAEILEEKNWKQLVKGADLTGKLKGYRTDEGGKIGASSRVKNLITIGALERMNIIDEDLAKALRRKATSSTHITDVLKEVPKLYDELFEGDNPRSLKVVQYIDDNTEELIPYAVKNFTRSEYGAKTEEELKSIDFIDVADDAKEELSDAVEDRFEKGVLGGIRGGVDYEKEIQDLPFDDVDVSLEELENKDEIAAKIVELLNTTGNLTAEVTPIGFNIEGPVGVFVDSDTITDQMNRLITKYFPNVGGRDIPVRLNTSVGEEDYEQIDDEEYKGPSMANNPGGAPSSYAQGEEGGGLTTPEDAEDELDHFLTKEQPEDKIPATDYEDVLAALVDDDKKKHAIKRLYGDDDDPGHIDDMRAEYPPDPFGGGYEDEERITDVFYKYVDIIKQDIYNGMTFKESMISNKIDPSHWNNLLDIYTEYMEDKTEGPFETGFENEEEFSYSPMLDSYKTSTAGYITEQAASDKRNKKAEVKNQSFKEKYKPKTHWQLEELRRYGL